MVTLENSIPQKSDAFLKGIDIFYVQFNDVNFYIEDEDQENFYYEIFKKLFPEIKLTKIFPLNGKDNVLKKAQKNKNDKKKIFLVDKDFDDILGKKVNQSNLFYLQQYSIENYLIDESTIKQYVIEEKPRTKPKEIKKSFKFEECVYSAAKLYHELTLMHLYVQSMGLNIKNTSIPPEKYFQFGPSISMKTAEIQKYENEIQEELNRIDKRLKVKAQIKKLKQNLKLSDCIDILIHIPGKYLIKYVKCRIEHCFSLASRNIDSFVYRLARINEFRNLEYFRIAVNNYTSLQ